MIKFIRSDTKKAQAAIKVLQTAKEKDSGYNKPEVNEALMEMFRGKCYICENKDSISSYQIEHLKPHRGNLEVKDNSAFTAFKRWILWDNKEKYDDLIMFCGLST